MMITSRTTWLQNLILWIRCQSCWFYSCAVVFVSVCRSSTESELLRVTALEFLPWMPLDMPCSCIKHGTLGSLKVLESTWSCKYSKPWKSLKSPGIWFVLTG